MLGKIVADDAPEPEFSNPNLVNLVAKVSTTVSGTLCCVGLKLGQPNSWNLPRFFQPSAGSETGKPNSWYLLRFVKSCADLNF